MRQACRYAWSNTRLMFGIEPTTTAKWLVVFFCVAALLMLWLRLLWPIKPGAARCGRCGYPATGLERMQCPECGSDFREVGMLAPRQRPRIRTILFLLLWSLLLPAPARVGSVYLLRIGPKIKIPLEMLQIAPRPGMTGELFVTGTGWGAWYAWRSAHSIRYITIIGTDTTGQWWQIAVNATTLSYDQIVAAGTPQLPVHMSQIHVSQPIDEAALLAFFASRGAETDQPGVRRAVEQLMRIITQGAQAKTLRGIRAGDYPDLNVKGPSWGALSRPPGWYVIAVVGGWVLLWIAGIVTFVIIQRRRSGPTARQTSTQMNPSQPV